MGRGHTLGVTVVVAASVVTACAGPASGPASTSGAASTHASIRPSTSSAEETPTTLGHGSEGPKAVWKELVATIGPTTMTRSVSTGGGYTYVETADDVRWTLNGAQLSKVKTDPSASGDVEFPLQAADPVAWEQTAKSLFPRCNDLGITSAALPTGKVGGSALCRDDPKAPIMQVQIFDGHALQAFTATSPAGWDAAMGEIRRAMPEGASIWRIRYDTGSAWLTADTGDGTCPSGPCSPSIRRAFGTRNWPLEAHLQGEKPWPSSGRFRPDEARGATVKACVDAMSKKLGVPFGDFTMTREGDRLKVFMDPRWRGFCSLDGALLEATEDPS